MKELTKQEQIIYDDGLKYLKEGERKDSWELVETALEKFRELTKLRPDFAEGQYKLGYTLMRLQRLEEAIPEVRKALLMNMGEAEWHNCLGVLYKCTDNPQEAIKEFGIAIGLAISAGDDTQAAPPYYNIGLIYAQQGKYREAIDKYMLVIELEDRVEYVYYSLAQVYEKIGEIEKAKDAAQKAIERYPKHYSSYLQLGRILGQLEGEYDEERNVFKKLIEVKPDSLPAWYYLGITYYQNDLYREAISCFEQMIKLSEVGEKQPIEQPYYSGSTKERVEDIANMYYMIGLCYKQLEEYSNAKENFLCAYSHNTGCAEYKDLAEEMEEYLSQHGKKGVD